MATHMRLSLFALGVLALALAQPARAADRDKFYVRTHRATYWNSSTSARARGLGGSYVALSNGASGVIENPAGLGAQTDREVTFDLGFQAFDEGSGENEESALWVTINAGGAFNINACAPEYWPRQHVGNHTAGFMIRHHGVDFDNRNGLASDIDGLALAYGRSFRGGQYFGGVAFCYEEGDLRDSDKDISTHILRWEFKAGGIYRMSRALAVGGLLALARGDVDGNGTIMTQDGELTHTEIRFGAAYQLSPQTLAVGDVMHATMEHELGEINEEHNMWKFSTGVEYAIQPDTLVARGGLYYFYDSYDGLNAPSASLVDDYGAVTGGLSYFKDLFELSYDLEIRTTGEIGHFLHLGYDW